MSSYAARVSPKRAAEILGVSVRTLEEWRRKQIGPAFVKLGPKLIRYEIADIERFLANSN